MYAIRSSRLVAVTLVCALATLVTSSCGSDSDSQSPPSVEEFDERSLEIFIESVCRANYECIAERNPSLAVFPSRFGDQETCVAEAREYYMASNRRERGIEVSSDVDRGLAKFNPDNARECLDSLEAENRPTCDVVAVSVSESPACRQVITGLQPGGAPCGADVHCASGTCLTQSDPGDTCWIGECADGTPEEPVVLTSPGADCSAQYALCGQGLTCDSDGEGGLRCISEDSQSAGEPCVRGGICQEGLTCLQGACTELTIVDEGQACDGQNTFCGPGTICGPTGNGDTLACQAPIAEGEVCYALQTCEVGLFCNLTDGSGTCEATRAEGESCASELACGPGLTCDDDTETCQLSACDIPTDQQSMSR